MSLNTHTSINDQISREAAEWLVEFRTGDIDIDGRREFDSWLRASPEHILAFIEMAALWHGGGAVDPRRQFDVEAIIARALSGQTITDLNAARGLAAASRSPTGSVLSHTRPSGVPVNAENRRRLLPLLAVISSLLMAGAATTFILRSHLFGPPTYATGVRARRSVVLPDGSRVLLDSSSRLQVTFTATARIVGLLQGQALFSVVRNPRRPFLVHVGDTVIRDVGTEFNVNRRGPATIVTVVEGRVAIGTPTTAGPGCYTSHLDNVPPVRSGPGTCGTTQPIYLSAGEQFNADRLGHFTPRPIRVDISSVTAWAHGQVVLESATLMEAVQTFGRYSARKLVVHDLGQKPLRLSGVFDANPDFLIRYLRKRSDVVVTESNSEIDIVRDPGN
jgi:transmembrane sensor